MGLINNRQGPILVSHVCFVEMVKEISCFLMINDCCVKRDKDKVSRKLPLGSFTTHCFTPLALWKQASISRQSALQNLFVVFSGSETKHVVNRNINRNRDPNPNLLGVRVR